MEHKFLEEAHCENHVPSSKRLWGAIMVLCSQIILIAATILSFIAGTGITDVIKDLIQLDIIVGSSLIGLTSITRMFGPGGTGTIAASNLAEQPEPQPKKKKTEEEEELG